MPLANNKKLVAKHYALDYYRRPLVTRLWKRRWNWLALLAALLVTAALYFAQQDELFQAGPISPAHVTAGATCKDCHDQAWQPALRLAKFTSDLHSVSDAACQKCHQEIADHHQSLGTAAHACASCHQEHRGSQRLTQLQDSQCTSCHGNLAELATAPVGFHAKIKTFATGVAEHPEFAILRNETQPNEAHGVWRVARFDSEAGKRWMDVGGVKFNHQAHLATEGLLDADRKPVTLACAACHTEDASGETMAPVNYQQHCATCHPLRLSGKFESLGDLPHRQPEILRGVIRDRLSRQTVVGEEAPSRIPLLPKPAALTSEQVKTVDELLGEAEHAVLGLEAKGMCRKCHHVVMNQGNWEVLPAIPTAPSAASQMIPRHWLQHGRFDHSSHRTVDCNLCHEADRSERTSDILLPSIATCRTCHGAVVTTMANGVGDSCVMCHAFHKHDVVNTMSSTPCRH